MENFNDKAPAVSSALRPGAKLPYPVLKVVLREHRLVVNNPFFELKDPHVLETGSALHYSVIPNHSDPPYSTCSE